MGSGFLPSFLGAFQASLSVLLTIFYGVAAQQFGWLSGPTAKHISKACVHLFLPALLIHNVGSQLDADTGMNYLPVLAWSILYNSISIVLGFLATRIPGVPQWVSPAIAFNNTTSLPLLLIESLQTAGILDSLLQSDSDSTANAVQRAKSYFLINAIVSNTLTFGLGPKLLNGQEEDGPDTPDASDNEDNEDNEDNSDNDSQSGDEEDPDENTSLVPNRAARKAGSLRKRTLRRVQPYWNSLPEKAQDTLKLLVQFLNAPLIGAVIGAIIGLSPPLHKAFFADTQKGGIFTAWLTSSIKNIGDLFPVLQVIVVGVKLSQSLGRMKNGESSGKVPWGSVVLISIIRYVIWPLIAIPLIWVLATKTDILPRDPILWFTLMLMPAGPPAMKLTALADVNGSPEEEKMGIAKFLAITYSISPLICFSVVGSLKACQAATSS